MNHRHVHLVDIIEEEQNPKLAYREVRLIFEDNDDSKKLVSMPFIDGVSDSLSAKIEELRVYINSEDISELYKEPDVSVYEYDGVVFAMKLEAKHDDWLCINPSWPTNIIDLFSQVFLPLGLVDFV